MSHVVIDPDLDVRMARDVMEPRVAEVLRMLTEAAQRHAPPVKVWVSKRDALVRPSHVEADGQMIPSNLRFKVPKVNTGNDLNDVRAGFDLARFPRDPDLPVGNRINCRCADPSLPHPLKQSIRSTQVMVIGTRVEGSVETRFPRAAESEFGTDRDRPAYFMTRALQEVAARLEGAQAR